MSEKENKALKHPTVKCLENLKPASKLMLVRVR